MSYNSTLDWEHPRWKGIFRPYTREDVYKLGGTFRREFPFSVMVADELWALLQHEPYIHALGASTGNQAVQMAKAGLRSIYLSGWQVAADANTAGHMYPDQSLYPSNSVPTIVRNINQALERADQVEYLEIVENKLPDHQHDFLVPIVADAESGFGGLLNAYELMKAMIEAGAAGVHFEDQLSSAKKCGHMGGKVLIPTQEFIQKLIAARLAADVMGVPTVLLARTDAMGAKLLTGKPGENEEPFLTGETTAEGFSVVRSGIEQAISRGLAYAPYADLVWCETATPDLNDARKFAEAIRDVYPNKMLAYNCSPSFNWKRHLSDEQIAKFQRELGAMGYKYQFITLAGFHSLNYATFDLADKYRETGMTAFVELQEKEFAAEERGYSATKHQREVGAGYFDEITRIVTDNTSSIESIKGSTEEEQF